MTYGEVFLTWLTRILIVLLIIGVIGMAAASVSRARQAVNSSDALIERCDAWAERERR